MPQYWLSLSDPESYHVDELFKKQREVWDGVFGAMAKKHVAGIKKGARVLGYHTAVEKSIQCELRAASAPCQDPEPKETNLVLRRMKLFQFFRPIAVSPLTAAECKEFRLDSR